MGWDGMGWDRKSGQGWTDLRRADPDEMSAVYSDPFYLEDTQGRRRKAVKKRSQSMIRFQHLSSSESVSIRCVLEESWEEKESRQEQSTEGGGGGQGGEGGTDGGRGRRGGQKRREKEQGQGQGQGQEQEQGQEGDFAASGYRSSDVSTAIFQVRKFPALTVERNNDWLKFLIIAAGVVLVTLPRLPLRPLLARLLSSPLLSSPFLSSSLLSSLLLSSPLFSSLLFSSPLLSSPCPPSHPISAHIFRSLYIPSPYRPHPASLSQILSSSLSSSFFLLRLLVSFFFLRLASHLRAHCLQFFLLVMFAVYVIRKRKK
eukprot:761611-Hanusia_phi.AAC.1